MTPFAWAILVTLVALVVAILRQPKEFRIERSIAIAGALPVVFAQVEDFRLWQAWSPWSSLDPQLQQTFEGSDFGTGAVHRWAGNRRVGQGASTIVESIPLRAIKIRLEMVKPVAAQNEVEFHFREEGDLTHVTWSMVGRNSWTNRIVGVLLSIDKMVGSEFEQGLVNLKNVVEAKMKM